MKTRPRLALPVLLALVAPGCNETPPPGPTTPATVEVPKTPPPNRSKQKRGTESLRGPDPTVLPAK